MTITIPSEFFVFLQHPVCFGLGFVAGAVAGALGLMGWVTLTALTKG